MQCHWTAWPLAAPALAVALATCLAVGLARAGESAETGETPPPRRAPGARVTAVLPAELPDDPSAATTILVLRDYEGEAKSAADVLAESVGVQVRRFGGPGNASELSIRGSTGSQVVILLDGVRLNSAQSGTVDLSTIPIELIERIEITRGGGSTQVGGGAIGGVVNIVTRRAAPEPQTKLVGSAGSFGTWTAAASHARRIDALDLVAGYDFFKTEGDWKFQRATFVDSTGQVIPQVPTELERVNNASERNSGLVKLGYDFASAHRVEVNDSLTYTSRGVPGLDSGGGLVGGQSLTAHERSLRNLADLRLLLGELLGGRIDADLRTFHRYQRQQFSEPNPRFGTPIDVDDRNHALGARAGGEGGGRLLGAGHWLRLEAEGRREWLVRRDLFDPERWVVAGAFQDEIRILDDRLALIPALRVEWTEGFDVEPLPRLGVVVEPREWLRLRANVERSYRAPSFDELFFPDLGFIRGNSRLEPEEALNTDVGLVLGYELLGPFENARFEVTYFYNDIANSIVWVPVSPFTIEPVNTNDATAQGIELGLGIGLLEWVDVSGNFTWLDTRMARTGAPIPGRPEYEATGRLRIGPASRLFKLVGEVHYASQIPVSESGRTSLAARTVIDASVAVNPAVWFPRTSRWIPEDLTLSLTGTNLTDQSVRDVRGFPQPGRWLTLALEGRW